MTTPPWLVMLSRVMYVQRHTLQARATLNLSLSLIQMGFISLHCFLFQFLMKPNDTKEISWV